MRTYKLDVILFDKLSCYLALQMCEFEANYV